MTESISDAMGLLEKWLQSGHRNTVHLMGIQGRDWICSLDTNGRADTVSVIAPTVQEAITEAALRAVGAWE